MGRLTKDPELFQSTHPGGVRPINMGRIFFCSNISIHAPGWGATAAKSTENNPNAISIHAPGWGATTNFQGQNFAICDFNPRTRVGCDHFTMDDNLSLSISIHAPGWGATAGADKSRTKSFISIHAPGWGATFHRLCIVHIADISIHAPGWGATCNSSIFRAFAFISIQAPGWGATHGR